MQHTPYRQLALDFKRMSERSEYHHTDKLALRPMALADAWALFDACKVPAFTRNLLWSAPRVPREMFERVEDILTEVRLNRMAAVSIVLRETSEWVGLVRYFESHIEAGPTNAIEGGVWLHPKFWHARLGREIGSLMSSACFIEEPRLQHIVARTSKANRAVNAMVADIGFSVIGEGLTHRENQEPMPILHHAITRAEWEARPPLNQIVETVNRPVELRMAA
jgi:RimJ/RimL family protein N-acetyltransferase